MPLDVNHISPCISHEGNGENGAQNKQLRRSGDRGDICSLPSSPQNHQTKSTPKELQDWCNNNAIIPKQSVSPLPNVKKVLDKYLAFDFEWDVKTHVIEVASFVDSIGNSKVLLRSDFDNCS
jgi:hypothetical protein